MTEPVEVAVRPATPDDAEGISRAHILAWQQTCAHLVAPGELDDLPVTSLRMMR